MSVHRFATWMLLSTGITIGVGSGCKKPSPSSASGAPCGPSQPCPSGYVCEEVAGGGAECVSVGCESNADCGRNQVCVEGGCEEVCLRDGDCPDGFICGDEDICVSAPDLGPPPFIERVDGTGTTVPDDAQWQQEVSGEIGGRRVRDQLRVRGSGLAEASFSLVSSEGGGGEFSLSRCGASNSDSEVSLDLPDGLQPGRYTLTAVNQAGECSAPLTFLKGEPGSLDASGSQMVVAINDAVVGDSQQRVHGTLQSEDATVYERYPSSGEGVSTLSVRGSVLAGDVRARVNGFVYPEDALSGSGFFLLVFDLLSHTVYDAEVDIGEDVAWPTVGLYGPGEISELTEVLESLEWNHVVLLSSVGENVEPFVNDSNLQAAIEDLGGSHQFGQLVTGSSGEGGVNESYALIGSPGLGSGNGMERLSAGPQGAELTTVAVDQAVLGFLSRAASARSSVNSERIADDSVTSADIKKDSLRADDVGFVGGPGSADAMHISSDGSIGIGVASPTEALNVAGNADVSGSVTADSFDGTLAASDVQAGTFGADTGEGDYSFPRDVGVGNRLNVSGRVEVGGSETVMSFDNGASGITVHDGNGNFSIVTGIDDDNNIVGNTNGGSRLELSESGWFDLETYTSSGEEASSLYVGKDLMRFSGGDVTVDESLSVDGAVKERGLCLDSGVKNVGGIDSGWNDIRIDFNVEFTDRPVVTATMHMDEGETTSYDDYESQSVAYLTKDYFDFAVYSGGSYSLNRVMWIARGPC